MTALLGQVRVRVPATSANLGPGFDALGLALDLHDEVTVAVTPGGLRVEVEGEGQDRLRRDERHLVVRALRASFAALGAEQPRGLHVRCANRIPQSRGLGSSAAAVVAGVVAARHLLGADPDTVADLAVATELEGHPDNAAAALLGGLTVAWCGPGGPRAVAAPVVAGLRPVALVPPSTTSTAAARAVLPTTVPHVVASRAAGRAALLVTALAGRLDLLLAATEDELHQPSRLAVQPQGAALLQRLRSAGVAAVLSGSGPTLLALCAASQEVQLVVALCPRGWRALPLDVASSGAEVAGEQRASRPR